MKRDPGPTNLQFFGFGRGPMPETRDFLPPLTEEIRIPGRRGAAERNVRLRHTAPDVTPFRCAITTEGWYPSTIELNDHQFRRLLDEMAKVEMP